MAGLSPPDMFVWKLGFLDGLAGLDISLFMARYEYEVERRFRALRREQG